MVTPKYDNPGNEVREIHSREISDPMPNHNLHPAQFAGHGLIGNSVFNRTGSTAGTEMSESAHHTHDENAATSRKRAAEAVESGNV